MGIYLAFLLIYFLSVLTRASSSLPEVLQYCENEEFTAQCGDNEAVVMESAMYGRMRAGKCITQQFDHTPCHVDVMMQMDNWCSGRRSCSVKVTDLVHETTAPCQKDLRSYLEASYSCVTVMSRKAEDCYSTTGPRWITSRMGYISSAVNMEAGCGSSDYPWLIQVPTGQKINFTLYDFTLQSMQPQRIDASSRSDICMVFATIKETIASPTETVCGGRSRVSHVHVSSTSKVEVRLIRADRERMDEDQYYLLKYEAIGCPDPVIPPYAWLRRTEHKAVVGCNASSASWQLTCQHERWLGDVGTCSKIERNSKPGRTSHVLFGNSSISGGLSVVIIVGIAVCVGLLILLMGIICIRKRRLRNTATRYGTACHYPEDPSIKGQPTPPHPDKHYQTDPSYYSENANNYYPTWTHQGQGHQLSENYTGTAVPPTGLALTESNRNSSKYFDHVYESPHFERRELPGAVVPARENTDHSKYFELDPKMTPAGKVESCKGLRDTPPEIMNSYASGRYST